MSWGPCQQLWSQEWDGKEVTGRVGVQAVVQKGRRALRKGGIKRKTQPKASPSIQFPAPCLSFSVSISSTVFYFSHY